MEYVDCASEGSKRHFLQRGRVCCRHITTDLVDEHAVPQLKGFDGMMRSFSNKRVTFEVDMKEAEVLHAEFEPVTDFIGVVFGDHREKVTASDRNNLMFRVSCRVRSSACLSTRSASGKTSSSQYLNGF